MSNGCEYLSAAVCATAVEDYRKTIKKILKIDLQSDRDRLIMDLHRIEKEMEHNIFWEYSSPDVPFKKITELIKEQEGYIDD